MIEEKLMKIQEQIENFRSHLKSTQTYIDRRVEEVKVRRELKEELHHLRRWLTELEEEVKEIKTPG
jgi:seryl-tRNA synthetase